MRIAALIAAVMLLVIIEADASSEASAFTRSLLILNESSAASLKTISQNSFSYAPGLYVKGYGEASSSAKSSNPGSTIIDQSLNFSTMSSQYLGLVSSRILTRNLTELDVSLLGISSAGLYREENLSLVRSESSGLGLAYPGEGRYAFLLTGGHHLQLDPRDQLLINANNLSPYEFRFKGDELRFDEPVDLFDQRTDLFFSLSADLQSSYAGYSLSRSFEDDGTRSRSDMEYGVVADQRANK
jgi:hypothetical protein